MRFLAHGSRRAQERAPNHEAITVIWASCAWHRCASAYLADSDFKQRILCSHSFAISPRLSREFCLYVLPSKIRGCRECRAPDAPAASCAKVESTRVRNHGHTGSTRHSLRNGFNGFLRTLPGDRALLSPSPADNSANLMPASRHQDHTTSPSANSALSSVAPLASTASRPTFVTIAIRPSVRDRTAGVLMLIWGVRKPEYF
jgi:hypothetical protein